jgi:hypothetical protein
MFYQNYYLSFHQKSRTKRGVSLGFFDENTEGTYF